MRFSNLMARAFVALAAPVSFVTAQDFGNTFTPDDTAAGGAMVGEVSKSTNNITNLIMGPGMYVVMAIGALLALYGFGRGQKETLFSGIGMFVFAAILRGVWAFL